MSRKATVRFSKSLRMDQLIFPLILISIAALFSHAQQGSNCNIDLHCLECNETADINYCTKCAGGFGFVIDPPNATKCARCVQSCPTCGVIGKACLQCRPSMGPFLSGSNIGGCGPCSTDENCNGRCDNKGAGRCDSCELEYGLTNGNTTCSPCVPHCLSCDTNITFCDLCDDNYSLYPNKSCGLCSEHCSQGCHDNGPGKCDRCDVGYGLTPAQTCDLCAPNCTTCAVNGAGKCDRCDTGFNLTPTNTCTPICAPNCTKCVVNGPWQCDQCDNGFRLTSSKNCTPICAPNCTICYANGPGKCDQCDKGFTLTPAKNCTPNCSPNCTICNVNGPEKCDQCDKGFTLTPEKNCTPICAPNCPTCVASGPGKCDQCDTGFTLTSDKNCTPIITTTRLLTTSQVLATSNTGAKAAFTGSTPTITGLGSDGSVTPVSGAGGTGDGSGSTTATGAFGTTTNGTDWNNGNSPTASNESLGAIDWRILITLLLLIFGGVFVTFVAMLVWATRFNAIADDDARRDRRRIQRLKES